MERTDGNLEANAHQVGGSHYLKHGDLQHWDVCAIFNLGYFEGQITKYLFRWRDKGGLQDLHKARHYLDKYIEIEAQKAQEALQATTTHPDNGARVKKPRVLPKVQA